MGYPGRVYRQGAATFFQVKKGDSDFLSAKNRTRRVFSAKDFFQEKRGARSFWTYKKRGQYYFAKKNREGGSFSGNPLRVQNRTMVMVSNKCWRYCWIDIPCLKCGSFRANMDLRNGLVIFLRLTDSICLILLIVIADNGIWQKGVEKHYRKRGRSGRQRDGYVFLLRK